MSFSKPVYNGASYIAQGHLNRTQESLGKSIERLSSGYRINRASDDAAGLGISEGMRANVRGKQQALRNANDAINLLQTAEGGMNEVHALLQRMRELAVQSSNATNSANDRSNIDLEVQQLNSEISRIATKTTYNGTALISAAGTAMAFQVDSLVTANDTISWTTIDATTTGLTLTTVSVTTVAVANSAITFIDTAITALSAKRSIIGAAQNRLESTRNNLSNAIANLAEAESGIRNVDIAEETTMLTRYQVLQQAGTSVLASANQLSYSPLALLKQ